MAKLIIELDDDLKQNVKLQALKEKKTIKQFITELLNKTLKKQ
jgi:hypothetical protein